jgi:hypothetical protein
LKNEIKIKKVVVLILFVLIAGLLSCGDSGSVNTGNFPKRWGTDAWSGGTSVAVDSSDNVFVTGGLDGDYNRSHTDIFLVKTNNDGEFLE